MVSIIIPYNRDRGYLAECMASVNRQREEYELILSKSEKGVAYNFNWGLEKARGEFVKFIAEDDYLTNDSLTHLVKAMGGHDWIVGNSYRISGGQVVEKYRPDDLSLEANVQRNRIDGGTTLYRTELLRKIGGMDETLWTGEEYDMHLKLLYRGYKPGYVDEFIYFHRLWPGQKSRRLRRINKPKRDEAIRAIQARYTDAV